MHVVHLDGDLLGTSRAVQSHYIDMSLNRNLLGVDIYLLMNSHIGNPSADPQRVSKAADCKQKWFPAPDPAILFAI